MDVKVGETVRFLNSTGGGRVVKICDHTAYVVDEDGFEIPCPIRECIVVNYGVAETIGERKGAEERYDKPLKKDSTPHEPTLPIVETANGNKINAQLAFEPLHIKTLSKTNFDVYFVNDSNYWLYITIANKPASDNEWSLFYCGLIEPNIQEPIGELEREQINSFERVAVQVMAFKKNKRFETKEPTLTELKVDTTKFFKLHCFRSNIYFEEPVLAFDIIKEDEPMKPFHLDDETIRSGIEEKEKGQTANRPHVSRPSKPSSEPIVIDLHASELLETTAGLSHHDILEYQIDHFRRAMKEHRKDIGRKIIFIHGKGNGVLRDAITKELKHTYPSCDVQDASFLEYGFGATQVTIRG